MNQKKIPGVFEISVMTLNIHKGKHAVLPRRTLSALRDFLASHSIDVLFLQEVIGSDPSDAFLNQAEYLAEGLSSQFCYGHNRVLDRYHHGNAILSRFPIIESRNTDLSTNRFEKRGLLEATIECPGGLRFKAFCCHLNLLRESRRTQVRRITEALKSETQDFSGPLFFGGDFNDWPRDVNAYLMQQGWKEVGEAKEKGHFMTFPSWWPTVPLDRLYYRNAELVHSDSVSYGALGLLSDHLPLLGRFRISLNQS